MKQRKHQLKAAASQSLINSSSGIPGETAVVLTVPLDLSLEQQSVTSALKVASFIIFPCGTINDCISKSIQLMKLSDTEEASLSISVKSHTQAVLKLGGLRRIWRRGIKMKLQ